MTKPVFQLVYVSSADPVMAESDLMAILGQARENNRKRGITGLLLYADGNIMQLLEGERESVEEVFRTITADPRHSGVIRLLAAASPARDFSDWSMGFRRVRAGDDGGAEGFNALLEDARRSEAVMADLSARVRTLFHTFRKTARL